MLLPEALLIDFTFKFYCLFRWIRNQRIRNWPGKMYGSKSLIELDCYFFLSESYETIVLIFLEVLKFYLENVEGERDRYFK
jgi:hypothetical protein